MRSYYISCIAYYHHNIPLGIQQSIQFPISTPVTVTTNAQSLLSSDQQQYLVLPPSKRIIQYLSLLMCLVNY